MNRYKAFALHLTASACILLTISAIVSLIWYPGILFSLAAGTELLRLLAVVDLILGPTVMLIIFNPAKKLLKLDICIVLLCQLSFLAYGLWSIFVSRPVFIVFVEDKFHLVRANQIEDQDLKLVNTIQFKKLPLGKPEYVGTQQPNDIKIKNDIVFAELGGMGLQNLPQYYLPVSQVTQQIIAAGKTSDQWEKIDADSKKKLAMYESAHEKGSVLFLLLKYKNLPLFVVVKAKTGEVIELI